jgi:lipoprotein NlpD
LILLVTGCGSKPRAPVEDRNARSARGGPVYIVQRGDTLYSIAFRYGMDYRKMAAANSIPAPYTIYAGQALILKEAAIPPPPPAKPKPKPAPSKPVAAAPRPSTMPSTPAPKPATSGAAPAASPTPAPQTATRPADPQPKPPATGTAVTGWRWPTTGRVVRGYSSSVHKGIDIGGNRGDPIVAVANGTVVYAGTGIVGMGELVIVKHSEVYLSAYAHNDRLLVGEGERVRAGQKIATKGDSGTDRVKLHFEIRKEGKPVDPTRLLPRR